MFVSKCPLYWQGVTLLIFYFFSFFVVKNIIYILSLKYIVIMSQQNLTQLGQGMNSTPLLKRYHFRTQTVTHCAQNTKTFPITRLKNKFIKPVHVKSCWEAFMCLRVSDNRTVARVPQTMGGYFSTEPPKPHTQMSMLIDAISKKAGFVYDLMAFCRNFRLL